MSENSAPFDDPNPITLDAETLLRIGTAFSRETWHQSGDRRRQQQAIQMAEGCLVLSRTLRPGEQVGAMDGPGKLAASIGKG